MNSNKEKHAEILERAKQTIKDKRSHLLEKVNSRPMPTEYSDEFLGVYVFGGHKEFTLEDHETALLSFRKFSQKIYPLYFFYSDQGGRDSDENFKKIISKCSPIEVVNIEKLKSFTEYSKFMLWDMWNHIPEKNEKILTFQDDGHLANPGWEDFLNEHDPDFLGAYREYDPKRWKEVLYLKDLEKFGLTPPSALMNGGFSFRKRSKMVEISNLFSEKDIDYDELSKGADRLNEDMVINYLGFGKGILKLESSEVADKFSTNTMTPHSKTFGFHGITACRAFPPLDELPANTLCVTGKT